LNASKRFFFNKKQQKTFDATGAVLADAPESRINRRFLVFFFQKEALPSATVPCA